MSQPEGASITNRRKTLVCDEFLQSPPYHQTRPQGSGDWLIIYTVEGSGHLVTPTGESFTHPGDLLLYAPGEYQNYGIASESGYWHLLWAHFLPKPHWLPGLQWPRRKNGLALIHLRAGEFRSSAEAALRRMITFSRRPIPQAIEFAFNALEECLLWAYAARPSHPWQSLDPRIQRAMEYLISHRKEPFSLPTLAEHAGLSVSRFSALFKKETGVTPFSYLEEHRLRHACDLLRLSSLNIEEVGREVGFEDPFYFSNRFRKFTGLSPSRYRLSQQNHP